MILDVEQFLTPTSAVAGALEGFEERHEQKRMALAVSSAFEENRHLLVEAGTGTGKSFAYLLPALKRVVEKRERVLISTNTINLQEQLIERDIPVLLGTLSDPVRAVLVKGRGNYISLRRMELALKRRGRIL